MVRRSSGLSGRATPRMARSGVSTLTPRDAEGAIPRGRTRQRALRRGRRVHGGHPRPRATVRRDLVAGGDRRRRRDRRRAHRAVLDLGRLGAPDPILGRHRADAHRAPTRRRRRGRRHGRAPHRRHPRPAGQFSRRLLVLRDRRLRRDARGAGLRDSARSGRRRTDHRRSRRAAPGRPWESRRVRRSWRRPGGYCRRTCYRIPPRRGR